MEAARVAKNTGFLYARIVVNIIVSLYSTRLILEALGEVDFGIYSLVAGVIAMLAFLNSSMAEASLRFMAFAQGEDDFNKQKSVFNVSLVLHFVIGIVVILLLEIGGYFLFRGVLEIPEERVHVAKVVYQFMLVSTFFTIIKVPYDAVLKAHENMFIVALLGIVEAILKLVIAIYVTYTSYDQLIAYGLLMAALAVFLIVISFIYCHFKYQEVKVQVKANFDRALFKEMGSFASWSFLIHSAYIVTMQGTTIVLNAFFGVVINAAQGIANQVSNQIKNFLGTMQTALNPVIVKRESKKDRAKMLEASMFGNKIAFFVLAFMSIPLLIEMDTILNIWLKDVPEFAVIFCRLQLIRLVVGALTQTFYMAIGAIGNIKKYSIWESVIFIAILPLSYIMFKYDASPEVIYLNMIVAGAAISVIRVYFLKKLGGLSVSLFLKNIVLRSVGVFVLAFAIALTPLLMKDAEILRLLLVLTGSSGALLLFGYVFGFNPVEKKQLFDVIRNFRKKVG